MQSENVADVNFSKKKKKKIMERNWAYLYTLQLHMKDWKDVSISVQAILFIPCVVSFVWHNFRLTYFYITDVFQIISCKAKIL